MLRLVLPGHIAEQYKEKGAVYFPDFIIYDFDEEEYQAFWQEIASHPRERLYTDGIYIVCVGWFRYLFESFKGWLGFENHCQHNRVELTLAKIAYAGYLKGFKSNELQQSSTPPISLRFTGLISSSRTNQTSKELQQLLMSYFITHSYAFPELNQFVPTAYPFGQTFIHEGFAYLAPSIDLQDSKTIRSAIQQINAYRQTVSKSNRFKSSLFAEAYALSLVEQREYLDALEWSPDVKIKFKETYINFYLNQEENNEQSLKNAIELIAALSLSSNQEDQNKAISYVKDNFNYEEQATFLNPYPELRNKIAKDYLNDAKNEKRKWSLTKLFTGNQTIEYLSQAVRLAPDILNQDDSMHDVMLREEWVLYQFKIAIDGNHFQEADTLYENHPKLKFNKKYLERLRDHYFDQLSIKDSQIRQELTKRNTQAAEELAVEQVALSKKIVRIKPQEYLVMTAIISYATTLLAIDAIKHPAVKEADLEQLNKAQSMLNECLFLNNFETVLCGYNKILLRKINSLVAKLGVPINYSDDLSTRRIFVKEHQKEIDDLKKDIKIFISVNEAKTKGMRQIIAKMYYLLGDSLIFFEEKKQESIVYFKKAKELMPENHYYNLRYLEIIGHEKRHEVRQKINDIGYLQLVKYENYMIERWHEEKIMSNGFDIHAVLPNDSGLLNALSKTVGLI